VQRPLQSQQQQQQQEDPGSDDSVSVSDDTDVDDSISVSDDADVDGGVVFVVCCGCGDRVGQAFSDIDHRQPRFLGGLDVPANLQSLCLPCHRAKSLYEQRVLAPMQRVIKKMLLRLQEDGVAVAPRIGGGGVHTANFLMQHMVPDIDLDAARNYALNMTLSASRKRHFAEQHHWQQQQNRQRVPPKSAAAMRTTAEEEEEETQGCSLQHSVRVRRVFIVRVSPGTHRKRQDRARRRRRQQNARRRQQRKKRKAEAAVPV
jgi:hypothetical protein